jgi:hypothetical protein
MILSEYLKNEEFERLARVWRRLNPLQRKLILAQIFVNRFEQQINEISRGLHYALERHIQHRRAKYAYQYPAHWMSR